MALDVLSATLLSQANVSGLKNQLGLATGLGSSNVANKSQTYVASIANNQPLGCDESYFLLLSIGAGLSTSINLQSLTDIAAQSASLTRLKGYRLHLLSATDAAPDGTLGTACASISTGQVTVLPPIQAALSTSGSGGSIAAGTYYYTITSKTVAGETVISNERSVVTSGATSTNTVTWAVVPNATGYKIYRSTSAGTYGASSLLATIGSGATVTYSDTNAATGAGQPPATNGAYLPTPNLLNMTGTGAIKTINNGSVDHYGDGSAVGMGTISGSNNLLYLVNNDLAVAAKVLVTLIGATS